MKALTLHLNATHILANRVNLGCWTDRTDEQIYQKLFEQIKQVVTGGTIKISDEGFSNQANITWYLLTQFWVYDWSKNWMIKLQFDGCPKNVTINQVAKWCERSVYRQPVQIPVTMVQLLTANQLLEMRTMLFWTSIEMYRLGCRVRKFVWSPTSQLLIIELRATETKQWLGYRMVFEAQETTTLTAIVPNGINLASNGKKREINNHIEYKAYDKLWLETQDFKVLFQKQKEKWQDFWQRFDLTWEDNYLWEHVYHRLMYQIYLEQSLLSIQTLMWADPLSITGDFSCLTWQCDWRTVLTGLLTWLIGGKIVAQQLLIMTQPQLPLTGQRRLTIFLIDQSVKIRLNNAGMSVQPSKPLKVVSQGIKMICQRQCWTIIWQNY